MESSFKVYQLELSLNQNFLAKNFHVTFESRNDATTFHESNV